MITSERVNVFKDTKDPLEGVTEGLYVAVEIIIKHFLKIRQTPWLLGYFKIIKKISDIYINVNITYKTY